METSWAYFLARLLTCGLWAITGVYALFHYRETMDKMRAHHIPWPGVALALVLVMKFGGSVLVITDQFVWVAALAWLAFMVVVTLLYHCRWYDEQRKFIFLEMVQLTKNVSMAGGLLCLLLLDPAKPQWLVDFLR